MKHFLTMTLMVALLALGARAADNQLTETSPNGNLVVHCDVLYGKVYYDVTFKGKTVIKPSLLGFDLVGIRDVMGASKIESAGSFRFFECYAIVMLIYWACTIVLTFLQRRLEKRCNAIYV